MGTLYKTDSGSNEDLAETSATIELIQELEVMLGRLQRRDLISAQEHAGHLQRVASIRDRVEPLTSSGG